MRLIALKKLKYPISRDGKEYQAGESFEALSERDFKVLTAAQLAKAPDTVPPPTTQRAPEPPPVDELATLRSAYAKAKGRPPHFSWDAARIRTEMAGGSYRRTDMRAED